MRIIDLGACADLRNGYNYEPESGILDPRYGPPEQYIMPQVPFIQPSYSLSTAFIEPS